MRCLFNSWLLGGAAVIWAAPSGLQPYIQDVREDRAVIQWTTVEDSAQQEVHYSIDGGFASRAPAQSKKFSTDVTGLDYDFWVQRAELTGLKPNTEYRYYVNPGSEMRFRTAAPGPFRFLAFGDSGDGAPVQQGIGRRMEGEDAALVLHVGDLAYESGTFLQLQQNFFQVYENMMGRVPFYAAPGNHDYGSRLALAFRSLLSPPADGVPAEGLGLYYSFNWGDVHFTALDSNLPLVLAAAGRGEMLRWLEADLKNARNRWRIVFFHHTPFPAAHHLGDSNCALAAELIVPILERNNVHLVLNGHEHVYQRSKPRRNGQFLDSGSGTVYVTTGGGGYALHSAGQLPFVAVGVSAAHYLRVEVNGGRMTIQAIGPAGETIDQFELSARTAIELRGVRDGAAFGPNLAPGGLISIFGSDLARTVDGTQGLSVTVDGKDAPVLYSSRNQINVRMPQNVTGRVTLVVSGPNGAAETGIVVNESAPMIFSGAVVHADGRAANEFAPAAPGEWLSVFLTGLGRLRPARVDVGGLDAQVIYAGEAPGLPGVDQVNFRLPATRGGQAELRVFAGIVSSNAVPVFIQ